MRGEPDPRLAFLEAALWHGSLEQAEAILAAHPEVAGADIQTAAVLGDAAAVLRFLERDPGSVWVKSPPYGGDALNYLCLSRYLRLDRSRTDGFLRAATALLDAGADPNTGFWTTGEHPEHETALYGAAGVAHHPDMTRLLLERGADPNDEEVVYHSPEEFDLRAMQLVVETGRVTLENLALMLVRKHDWHDLAGVKYLLEKGADPNLTRSRGLVAVQHAIVRDNDLPIIELLLDHGADMTVRHPRYGHSAIAMAARRGRSDVLDAVERRGISLGLDGVDRLIAACARNDTVRVRALAEAEPALVQELVAQGGRLLAEFAGNDNPVGLRHLLDLGVPVGARFEEGDGYWGVAEQSTALHVAAWRCSHASAKLLIQHGAAVNPKDQAERSPLMLAVKACVDSYWTEWRAPDTVAALLTAGASVEGVRYPSGYPEVDELLRAHGARAVASSPAGGA